MLHDVLLGEDFHRKNLSCLTELDLHDFPEASLSDELEELEILDTHGRLEGRRVQFHERLVQHLDPRVALGAALGSDEIRTARRLDLKDVFLPTVFNTADVPRCIELYLTLWLLVLFGGFDFFLFRKCRWKKSRF